MRDVGPGRLHARVRGVARQAAAPVRVVRDGMILLLLSTGHDVEVDLGVGEESPVDEALHAWIDKWQLRALPELPPELSP